MLPPRRILAAVPPNGQATAVAARATALARRYGADLRLATAVYDPYVAGERFADSPDLQAARATLVSQRHHQLEVLAAPARDQGLEVSVSAVWAYPVHEGLLAAAAEFEADLLVCGTFQHSFLQRAGLTNTDWELLRQAACPVLLVHGEDFGGYHRVLVAVDPMHAHDPRGSLDDRLVAAGQACMDPADGRLTLLHCFFAADYVPLVAPGAAAPSLFYQRQSPAEAHRAAVTTLAERHGLAPAAVRLESGDARTLIPAVAAEESTQLLVMGVIARSRLAHLLVGSTAEAVLDRLACDVLVVRPEAGK